MTRRLALFLPGLFILSLAGTRADAPARPVVTTPKQFLGFNLGDDYCLANYQQFAAYVARLEKESDRVKVVDIGKTEEGRSQLMAVVTSPANHKNLPRLRETARKLALAEGLTEAQARELAAEGKAVVWIDGGLHATETLCAQALLETIYRFATNTDPETLRILDDVVILFVHANPDGMDLVADWYMRDKDPKRRSIANLPRLYQKYAGHDNNRDFYAGVLAETRNMNLVMYREWFPQVVYNHHQSGPPGTVMFCPPFRDPFNYNLDPLVVSGIDAVGAAMMQRFLAEGKPGVTSRSGARYSTWWNGGLRTTCYFHNMIGLLTETIGSPTPMRIPFNPALQLPRADYLAPVVPQEWHFRQSLEYSVTANLAILDYASRHREQLLGNIWRMGKAGIDRGSRDNWTITPRLVEAAKAARAKSKGTATDKDFEKLFRDPARRDPRGYVIPADQPDFLTATKFINTLIGTGVKVHRATAAFAVNGKSYPADSYVVSCAQAFRAHVLDMFEPQDHPDDFAYPGGPPIAPYDMAGWTLAYQMGIVFDRLLDGFDGPFEELTDAVAPPPGRVTGTEQTAGFFFSTRVNDSFRAANRLLAAGEEISRLKEPLTAGGTEYPAGTFFVTRKPTTLPRLEKIAAELGVSFTGNKTTPGETAVPLKPVRVGLWDRRGGSMPSGWTRWVLERFEFPFRVVLAPELDRGGLRESFDVLIFVDGAIPAREGKAKGKGGQTPGVTPEVTVPHLREFLREGGTILTIGSSTSLASHLGLPVGDHLATKDAAGKEHKLSKEKFYVPASVLRAKADPTHPLAWGLGADVDVLFSASPTFRLPADAEKSAGVRRVAWFDGKTPLRSGWALGQHYLDGGAAVVEADVGRGKLVLFGPEILFRAQPHGTFKFLFNGIAGSGVAGK